ncbi:MAG: class I SAM-dependent methyltransferase [Planctomycetota bacterium]
MATCRSCGSDDVRSFLDLGVLPLPDALRRAAELQQDEKRYPLEVGFCASCSLVQILEEVDPEEMFVANYHYYSSFSDALLRHSKKNVDNLVATRGLGPESLVVELASNDGYLLQYFVKHGVPVLGIDPSPGPAAAAAEKGIPTMETFFTRELAEQLVANGKQADVIVANNVMAHVPDVNGFVGGIAKLLKENGTTSIEAPYVRDLIEHCEFDTIYHEHLCYFSVSAVEALFERHDLHLNKVEHLDIHGGSLRYYASPTPDPDGSVERYLDEETRLGLDTQDFYDGFANRVGQLKTDLRELVARLKGEGKSIAAYGAAAKGAIMLNYVGLDHQMLDFVVDRNTHKQGRYMPGMDLEIRDPRALLEDKPDYTLLLSWNFKDEIMEQQQEYLNQGGKFIVPVPHPEVVSHAGVHSH